jgi:hypothetical protein
MRTCILASALLMAAGGGVVPEGLRCEFLADPLGIDVLRPRLSWTLRSGQRGQGQTAFQVLVASSPELLAADRGDLWDSGKVPSAQALYVEYGGAPLQSEQACFWKVRVWDRHGRSSAWSGPARWSMGLLRPGDWQGTWIASPLPAQIKPPEQPTQKPFSLPLLRKRFRVEGPVRSATLYVASLGYHAVYLNGRRVGDHVLDPVQSDYSRRVYYVTHDVSGQVATGDNAIGAALGKGWYWRGIRGVTQDRPALLAQLVITHADGSRTCVATDTTWRTADGPVSVPAACRNAGGDFGTECHDARREQPGWNTASFEDSAWQPAVAVEVPPVQLSAQMVQPNRVAATFRPVSVRQLGPGECLFDLGTNLTGWFRLSVRGRPGDEIGLAYFAGHLGKDNPLREDFGQADRYVCRGAQGEAFCSQFNYRAFRYVKVTGLSYTPKAEDARALLITTDTRATGDFECSDAMLNRLHRVVVHTHRCLTLGAIQVDCPHRERLGYGAEGQASSEQALYNFDMAAMYAKWARDFGDGQDPASGLVYYTAPFRIHSGGGPAWSGALIVYPWQNYLYYGDRRVLADQYEAMCRWLDFLGSKTTDGILQPHGIRSEQPGLWEFLGDWASPRRKQDTLPCSGHWTTADENLRFNNFHYCLQVSLAGKIAGVLGKEADARRHAARAEAIKQAVNRRFFDPRAGRYSPGEQQQTLLAFPLLLDIVPAEHRLRVADNLEKDIVDTRAGHLDFGVLGSHYALRALTRENRSDLVYRMVAQESWPGWGNQVHDGATTLWEHWIPGDSSIHNSFLSIGGWFYAGLAGIRPDPEGPGFQKIVIRPAPVGNLTWVRASYESVGGRIRSHWKKADGALTLEVAIPPGAMATVYVPTTAAQSVTEGGKPAAQAEGVRLLRTEPGAAVFEVSSGEYAFSASYGAPKK